MVMRKPPDLDDDGVLPVVPYVPFACPACGRNKPFTFWVPKPSGPGSIRFHRCQACGQRYKSQQREARDVIGFTDRAVRGEPQWDP